MSDEHEDRTGGWQPIPQSEGYDGDATAFVQLPPEFMLDGVPLEAPGHGYVPPMITPLTPLAAGDPTATGSWVVQQPAEAADPHATGQWTFPEASGPAHQPPAEAESAATGQWRIPVVPDGPDTADESGEYTASMLAPYTSGAPATLPGGAPAPWAEAGFVREPGPGYEPEPEAGYVPEPEAGAAPDTAPGSEAAVGPEAAPAPEREPEAAYPPAGDAVPAPGEAPEAAAPDEITAPPGEASAPAVSTGSSADSDEHPHTSYVLRVNGADRPVTDSWIGESLLYVLRERLGLAGAKDGCSQGECGACNVQVDGRLVASCLVPAATAAGSEVRTVEGLATDGEPSDVQRALAACGAVQCGFCIPGMAMTVHDLLEGNHAPTELETRQALCGNLCRCSGYRGVLDAVQDVVSGRAAAAADHADEARIPHQIPHPHDGGMA
ncbi:2Fe-2S iron-sulfur cluster-binding protein [Streptomyces sp. NPDC053755]|uniref:2Fe-2S iron-sulfur cluster-binding protein n=1 Tax=Streptomyces sp. NPDC053755 TaxID=3155815 RepID=UPI0034195D50